MTSRERVLLAAILVVGVVLRLIEASRNPLVLDEIYPIFLARDGIGPILRVLGQDIDHPLLFLVIKLWRQIGGESERWIQLLAVAIGTGTLPLVFGLGRDLFGTRAGLLATAFVAVHPVHVFFSQHLSVIVLESFLAVATAWAMWRWLERPSRVRAGLYVLAAAAGLYASYYFALILLATGLFGAVVTRRARGRFLTWVALQLVAAALFLPWFPTALEQLRRNVAEALTFAPMPAEDVANLVRKLALSASYLVLPLAALALAPLFRRDTRPGAAGLAFLVALPIALTLELSYLGIRVFIMRQMFFALPFLATLVAVTLVTAPWKRLAGAVAAVLLVWALRASWLLGPMEEGVDLAAASRHLLAHARPGEPIVCCETTALFFMRYHHAGRLDARLWVPPDGDVFHFSDGGLMVRPEWYVSTAAVDSLLAGGTRWWGIRQPHAGRDGKAAAVRLARAAAESLRFGRVTVWAGPSAAPADSAAGAPRP